MFHITYVYVYTRLKILTPFLFSVSVPESWAKFSNDNIQRSQAERAASKLIREEIENVLNTCSNEMYRLWHQVNASMSTRVTEVTDARNRLQAHLSKVRLSRARLLPAILS